MTVPASANTIQKLIRDARKEAGLLQEGQHPNSEQYADGLMKLQEVVNFLLIKGIKLFVLQDQSITLVAGTGLYTIYSSGSLAVPKPFDVEFAYYLDSSNNRRPIDIVGWDTWISYGSATNQGAINAIFVDKQATKINVNCWQVPDSNAATGTLRVVLRQQLTAYSNLTDDTQFPIEWYTPLRWLLADELTTGQPESIIQRCAHKAAVYREWIEDWDVDNESVRFAANIRGTD